MSVALRFRGRLARFDRLESLEDRVLELAFVLGGIARFHRLGPSREHPDPKRLVRGVLLDLWPGLDSIPLQISPEGVLVGEEHLDLAWGGALPEPPWVSVRTSYAPLPAHVALVETLRALGGTFLADLELDDPTGYANTGNYADLRAAREAAGRLEPALDESALEALRARIRDVLARPAEHPPVTFSTPDGGEDEIRLRSESAWDEAYRENERRRERLSRAMDERLLNGQEDEPAFEDALHDAGLGPVPDMQAGVQPARHDWAFPEEDAPPEPAWTGEAEAGDGADADGFFADDEDDDLLDDEDDADDSEAEDEDDTARDKEDGDAASEASEASAEERLARRRTRRRFRHPLLEAASELTLALLSLEENPRLPADRFLHQAGRCVLELSGGLAQALSQIGDDDPEQPDWIDLGQRLVQFKRALRGARFAQASLRALCDAQPSLEPHIQPLTASLQPLLAEVEAHLAATRAKLTGK